MSATPIENTESPSSSVSSSLKKAPYTWTQTLRDMTLEMKVPKGTPPKQLDIKIETKHLFIAVKGQPPILDADFTEPVIPSESSWQLEERENLTLFIQKSGDQRWWKSPCVGFEEVDVTKIEPETSKLSDLDPEARSLVEKMMYDQEAKRKGLPTSEELQKQEMLKKFMAAHPEMDFSQCKFG
ncbi:putative protein BOBBER 1 [Monocercomonoides exilis]|uniref:putative protein BOBBER 1 n=1 Tax=Monocercomonoides exilis TaxID=2049356 RepID=UPI00355A8E40|nr:putative protein BOBBER 1 [Monocercomonoides exilis]|eukprot:MONOS_12475.1-p1 / transcript=MONOS_12475.1 / gene=MONOS_12475 / organism=Monocercomonoides_exilis_PA203 / gene_product=salt tolerance protein 5 / transcript_product=salt tolerance protein 5 / location=Mono_scaffold00694:1297-1902(-) / protein_length=182 / sequence_SO=supercontig / SO=protein_coding / is_pseudo=false